MNIPSDKGDYLAQPAKWGVGETNGGLPQFVVQWSLTHFWAGTEWQDISGDEYEISSFNVLFNKDGQPNKINIETFQKVFGWDGRGLASLNDGEWSGVQARLYLERESYTAKDGSTKNPMKVRYINPGDSPPGGGGIKKADAQEIQSLEAKYGATLRAMNGAAPARGAAKPSAKPPATGSVASGVADAKKAAWSKFLAKWAPFVAGNPDKASERDALWKDVLDEFFKGGDPNAAAPKDWHALAAVIEKDWSPEVGVIPF